MLVCVVFGCIHQLCQAAVDAISCEYCANGHAGVCFQMRSCKAQALARAIECIWQGMRHVDPDKSVPCRIQKRQL